METGCLGQFGTSINTKSFDSTDISIFRKKDGGIQREMLPYFQDVAFQRHVLSLAYPHWSVSSFLMMADKSWTCTVDGLNQKFKISRGSDGRARVQVALGTRIEDLGDPVLSCVNVAASVSYLMTTMLATAVSFHRCLQ